METKTEKAWDEPRPLTLDVARMRELMLLCLGLSALLDLQYIHEGHRDEHVTELLSDKLHTIELELSNYLTLYDLKDVPF